MPDIVLNSRQWRLYDFIKARCESHIKRTNYDAILADIELNSDYARDNYLDQCRAIRKDVETINLSGIVQKPILSDKDGYYMPTTETEFKAWAAKDKKKILKAMYEHNNKCRKNGLNNYYFLDVAHHIRDHVEATVCQNKILQNIDK